MWGPAQFSRETFLHSSQCQGSVFLWDAKGADLLLVHRGLCPLQPQPSGGFSYQAPHYAQVVSCLGPRHRAPRKPMLFHLACHIPSSQRSDFSILLLLLPSCLSAFYFLVWSLRPLKVFVVTIYLPSIFSCLQREDQFGPLQPQDARDRSGQPFLLSPVFFP